jgi:N-acetylglucosaminyldiphosphoundecaprenol N-acetyl-beta-D-mannosaminyltransferase
MAEAGAALAAVAVGAFPVADASRAAVVERIVELAHRASRPVLVFALHVGGLNVRRDPSFVAAMQAADLVYADGGSVVWLARQAGAQHIERAPTTDIGWDVMAGLHQRLGRPVRLALVGGPPGLAERAGALFDASGDTHTVVTVDGYRSDWERALATVRDATPDLTVVGLGAPREMVWCQEWRDHLPPTAVLTCGGWFGHVVGDEKRAPRLLRRSGLEWIARTAQQPRRLGPRYAKGLVSTAAVAVEQRRAGGAR